MDCDRCKEPIIGDNDRCKVEIFYSTGSGRTAATYRICDCCRAEVQRYLTSREARE